MTSTNSDSHQSQTGEHADQSARQAAMAVFARATGQELESGLKAADCNTSCRDLRPPETGLVMARGRISGTGQPFNLGEVTVTRAVIQLDDGTSGYSYLRGRALDRARLAAIADAYWQTPHSRAAIEAHIIEPVKQRITAEQQKRKAEVAATQVDFFTVARGDD